MAEQRVQRRLAAILAADLVGYSRLMEVDEEGTRAATPNHPSGDLARAIPGAEFGALERPGMSRRRSWPRPSTAPSSSSYARIHELGPRTG